MAAEIRIRNLQNRIRVSKCLREALGGAVVETLRHVRRVSPVEISLLVVDNAYIRKVNRKYRKVDRATDVIAFPSHQSGPGAKRGFVSARKIHGGDVLVSVERARTQAGRMKHSLEREMALLAAHGVLHLFGYDHVKKKDSAAMRGKEEEILNCLGM